MLADAHLGGEDFNQRVVQYFIKLLKTKDNVDIDNDKRAFQKLRREVERVKRTLSSQHQAHLEIEGIVNGIDFSETLTRACFEQLNRDVFKTLFGIVQKVLEDANVSKSEVDYIVLVGGSTRTPMVQTLVKEFFDGKEPFHGINPDETVAYGAAIQGGILASESSAIRCFPDPSL